MKKIIIVILLTGIAIYLSGAVGCDLNDPDRDVKRLFPESTGYSTFYFSVQRLGGEPLLTEIENRLGDIFSGLYETIDVPYTIYEIYNGNEVIGYIHGVNQRGRYGGLQVFLVLDMQLVIKDLYLQRLSSKFARQYKSPEFSAQFQELSMEDFANLDITSGAGSGRSAAITSPTPEQDPDFLAILRGVKKNLILTEYFVQAIE